MQYHFVTMCKIHLYFDHFIHLMTKLLSNILSTLFFSLSLLFLPSTTLSIVHCVDCNVWAICSVCVHVSAQWKQNALMKSFYFQAKRQFYLQNYTVLYKCSPSISYWFRFWCCCQMSFLVPGTHNYTLPHSFIYKMRSKSNENIFLSFNQTMSRLTTTFGKRRWSGKFCGPLNASLKSVEVFAAVNYWNCAYFEASLWYWKIDRRMNVPVEQGL